jgi:Ca2+-binding RTX toxin-like protein
MLLGTGLAGAVITPTSDADSLAEALDGTGVLESRISGAELTEAPPTGNPAAVSDTPLALFPLNGLNYTILSSGNARDANNANDSDSLSTDNGSSDGRGGPGAFDLVTLRVDLNVPPDFNCLTVDYRFLTEEFDEFVGSQFNDVFLAELDASTFLLQDDGSIVATNNFAQGPDGNPTTVNSAGTSADNALGTTYDGATPILRASTPITPGPHSVYLSVFDVADAIFDSTAFIDNLKLRNVSPENCTLGAAGPPNEPKTCRGEEPTIFGSSGVIKGTNGDDVILGTSGGVVVKAGGGDDLICTLGGPDLVRGQGGADEIIGGRGRDDVRGNDGNEIVKGSRGRDTDSGQLGVDRVTGRLGKDRVFGGGAGDIVLGASGNDKLFGRRGDDRLNGGRGNDKLNGGPGNDTCKSGGGNDRRRSC